MDGISLFELKKDDREKADELAELAREIWTEHYTPLIGPGQVSYMLSKFQSAGSILNDIAANGYRYFIVYDGSKPAGYFAVKPEPDKKALFLSKFYLEKSCRGRGISRIMLDRIMRIARESGLGYIWLTVNKYNETSIKIYQRLGFRIVEDIVTDIGNGFVMDDYKMRLDMDQG
ncbi:MAG TPA: GNAT family N-acetyltransferase [Clostridiales bacterium]|nr:GNAT family N-acetyltransferase [Clostridiales bacterium]HOL91380.1 GNAT family N-acetyltransferase [Clostridiales bacterium]HPP35425.1 GNAT family N-acetyltransferase [Clostridiales bacterium]